MSDVNELTQNCFLTFFTTIKLVAGLDLFIAVECNRLRDPRESTTRASCLALASSVISNKKAHPKGRAFLLNNSPAGYPGEPLYAQNAPSSFKKHQKTQFT